MVSGYTISNIAYDLNATDPTLVDKITFLASPASGTLVAVIPKIQTATGGAWTDCVLVAGTPPSMTGTEGNDLILGSSGADAIDGLGGDDCILGGGEIDSCIGGIGTDVFVACESETQ